MGAASVDKAPSLPGVELSLGGLRLSVITFAPSEGGTIMLEAVRGSAETAL